MGAGFIMIDVWTAVMKMIKLAWVTFHNIYFRISTCGLFVVVGGCFVCLFCVFIYLFLSLCMFMCIFSRHNKRKKHVKGFVNLSSWASVS